MKYKSKNGFEEAIEFLQAHSYQVKSKKFPGEYGVRRTAKFLELLDNPDQDLKIIHIAGTSGKGSTATILSHIIQSQGKSVGLTLSPHILDIRERLQINNQLISKKAFAYYLDQLKPVVKKLATSEYGSPSYFEILTVLALHVFKQEGVEYAVLETGLGGLHDSTNAIKNKEVAILTRIGLDHTHILGNTIEGIAAQKAEIIVPNINVITIKQSATIDKVFKNTAKEKNATIDVLDLEKTIIVRKMSKSGSVFNINSERINLKDLNLNLAGKHQIENASLALETFFLLKEKFNIKYSEEVLRSVLTSITFNGRFSTIKLKEHTLILDSAHNPQKIKALVDTLKEVYPNKSFDFLLSFKKYKEYSDTLEFIIPIADHIYFTKFKVVQDMENESENFEEVEKDLNRLKFNNYEFITDYEKAFEMLQTSKNSEIVVTGSLFLVSKIYELL